MDRMVDWNDATFRTGFNQDYNASISGATERVNYYFSLGYINNEELYRVMNTMLSVLT